MVCCAVPECGDGLSIIAINDFFEEVFLLAHRLSLALLHVVEVVRVCRSDIGSLKVHNEHVLQHLPVTN